ncbi:MAG TPA: type II secretion protein F, partial [Rhodospirillales bacterium]|nr:type II secretion protein F [Rhodospirillales bacterium]
MLSHFILAAALLILSPSSAGRLASATRRAQ